MMMILTSLHTALAIWGLTITIWAATAVDASNESAPQPATAPVLDEPDCRSVTFETHPYVACVFDPTKNNIRLFLNDENNTPWRHFTPLANSLEKQKTHLRFAMNAGMYHRDRTPVGHYIENGREVKSPNTNPGPGNFHMLPNGVFFTTASGAGVLETQSYIDTAPSVQFATQSGPMLVIDGALHPRFLKDSDSLKRRNGVGVRDTGETVFVISDAPVNFHEFARFFRDEMKTPNALFLDGTISRLYAPGLGRADPGLAMGPIVAVTAPIEPASPRTEGEVNNEQK